MSDKADGNKVNFAYICVKLGSTVWEYLTNT